MDRLSSSVALTVLTAYAAVKILGRRAGSTAVERARALPGDDLVDRPQLVTDHGIDIAAPPERIWPWLTQMGWHRGGYYTPDWVDQLFFPANWPSLTAVDPELVRDLEVGDRIPDGPPGTAEYVVAEVRAPRVLVLRSTTHVPPGWDAHGAAIDWTWCLSITPLEGGRSARLHLRVRGRMTPWWFAAVYLATIVPADYIMATGMLRGLKWRTEADRLPEVSGRARASAPPSAARRSKIPAAEGPATPAPSHARRNDGREPRKKEI